VASKRETKRAREERLAARRARDAARREAQRAVAQAEAQAREERLAARRERDAARREAARAEARAREERLAARREAQRAEAQAEAQAREERLAARRARDAERREAARAEARAREERLAARRTRDAVRREERRAAVAEAAAIAAAQAEAEATAKALAREVRLAARRVRDAERRAKLRREKSLEPLANTPLGFEAAHQFSDGTLDGRIAQLAGDDLPGAWDAIEARAAELLRGKAGAWVRIGVFGKKRARKSNKNRYDESTPAASLAGIAPGSTGIWSGWRRVGATTRKRTKFTTLATAILAGREIAQRMTEKKFKKLNLVLDYSTRSERPPE